MKKSSILVRVCAGLLAILPGFCPAGHAQEKAAKLAIEEDLAKTGEPEKITLKRRHFKPTEEEGVRLDPEKTGRHLILQFESGKMEEALAELKARNVEVLEFVPRYAVSAFVPPHTSLKDVPGLRWAGSLQVEDKLGKDLGDKGGEVYVVVNAFPDAEKKQVDEHIARNGGTVIKNRYLKPGHTLVAVDAKQLPAIAAGDGVSFVFSASQAIVEGQPVHFCPGPLTTVGPLAEYATSGEGWDGTGLGAANLTYHFVNSTPDLTAAQQQAEVRRALNTWSQYAQITWTETALAGQNRSMDISWATGSHGDSSPFDGASGVLAHCYFPSPPNSEPVAGDMHLDDAETWRIGSNIDLFSVALHEAGHGLGLQHSSDTSAVMYPYYQIVTGLRSDDISGIRALYATTGGASGDSFEPDNTSAQAKTITNGSNQSHSIVPASDVDYAKFTLTAPAEVVIETSGGTGDTRLWLYNSSLAQIDFDDDTGTGLFSRIDRTVAEGNTLPAGTYYVKVDEYGNNNEIANYTLSLSVQYVGVGDGYEPDNTATGAKLIVSGVPQVRSLNPADDLDYLKIVLTAPSEVVIETSGASGDTRMWLFGPDLSAIEFNDDDGPGLFSRIDRTVAEGNTLPAGTYYVLIDEFGNDNVIASYTVNLTVTSLSSDDAYEQNDTRTQAYHPGFNWEATYLSELDGLGVQSDEDWYRIDVSPSGYERVVIDVAFTHAQGDVDIALYDSAGTRLALSNGFSNAEHIDYTVIAAGTYYIRVYGANAGNTYDLWWDDLQPSAGAQPNDQFASRIVLAGSNPSTTGSSAGATKEAGEPLHAGRPGGASVWWQWVAPASGTVTVSTAGSSFDTLLAVYTGSSIAGLTQVASNDDQSFGVVSSRVVFVASAGVAYQIAVDGYDAATGTVALSIAPGGGNSRDLNSDGKADLLFQNNPGQIAVWYMNGSGAASSSALIFSGSLGDWRLAGTGDMDGDGKADLLFQNTSGQIYVCYMNGSGGISSGAYLFTGGLGDWRVVGVVDMNGDGKADLVFQNTSGQIYLWYMNGSGGISSSAYLFTGSLGDWRVAGIADLDSDSNADVIFQNTAGQLYAWYTDGGGSVSSGGYLFTGALGAWRLKSTADLNGDVRADLVFQNATGQIYVWHMNGNSGISSAAYIFTGNLGDWGLR